MKGKKNVLQDVWKNVKIKRSDECWEWTKYKLKNGYGEMGINNKVYLVHRIVYEQIYGYIPDGLYILHKCNNPSCCNPKHLYLGTQKDNMKQMSEDGRSARGEKSSSAKLKVEDVLEIRKLYSTEKYYHWELGEMFGVSRQQITKILNNQNWKHI